MYFSSENQAYSTTPIFRGTLTIVGILLAVAQIMLPSIAKTAPPIMKYRRPKMSDRRPMNKKATAMTIL